MTTFQSPLVTAAHRVAVFLLSLLVIAGVSLVPEVRAQEAVDLERLSAMKARSIGPAGMSGRVTSIDVVVADPDVIYAGTASGGLWRSDDGGTEWTPLFDDQPATSIGAVAVFQNNPDVLWVGTGEGNPRNSSTGGTGLYKSVDGGETWTRLGLESSRSIHRVVLHPDNADVAYIGVQGATWGENEERGVYKTTDGGASFERVLFVDAKTGVADLVMDPSNPDKLIAAMWEYRRWPWFFKSGGPGSGLYVTHDGGTTWTERTAKDGLPKGDLGRMGLAIAPSQPDRVYAYVESRDNALYRSDDGGGSWTKVNDDMSEIGNRPFYYADIYVDPKNENRLYSIHSLVTMSEDAGTSFEVILPFTEVHPDHHAWWIHPDDPSFIVNGNDGGMAITRDRGASWRFVENLPLAQFYHINVDDAEPYHVYGGMQDNGSWRGPAYVWRSGGIRNAYWDEVAFGDGFDVVPDPADVTEGFAMSQGGNLYRYDVETGKSELRRPMPPEDGETLRFNWDAAIAQDPFDAGTIYYGSQFVHKSTDRGETWTAISPDLTTDDPEKQEQLESGGLTYDVTQAENFTTITAIGPSPLDRNVLWAGTDDGNVQITRDGGQTWTNVVDNIDGVPEGTWVAQVKPSGKNAATAVVVFDNHRRNDWTPYVFRTTNFGRSWTRLADANDVEGYALSFLQDPEVDDLMFLGTELGLYVSFDGGDAWAKWTHGVPTASVMDLAMQEREADLVLGTFGRSAYVLDDVRPLRALARDASLQRVPVTAFAAPDAVLAMENEARGTRFTADAIFEGENRSMGARLSYFLNAGDAAEEDDEAGDEKAGADEAEGGEASEKSASAKKVTIEIVDAERETVRTLREDVKPGLNRVVWDLRRAGERSPAQPKPKTPDAPEPAGAEVLPGTYTVRIHHGDAVDSTTVTVRPDPRVDVPMEALQARLETTERLMDAMSSATEAADRLREAKTRTTQIDGLFEGRDDDAVKAATKTGSAMRDSIDALMEQVTGKDVQGIRRDPTTVMARIGMARFYLGSSIGAPTQNDLRAVARAEARIRAFVDDVNRFFGDEWPAYRDAVDAAQVRLFDEQPPVQIGASEERR